MRRTSFQDARASPCSCSNTTCSAATTTTLDGSGAYLGRDTSITIGTDGLGLVTYTDDANPVKVAHCSDIACSAATVSTLDPSNYFNYTSVTIGADGLGLVAYTDIYNGSLRVAHCSNVLCSPSVRRR